MTPYSVSKARSEISPMKSVEKVKKVLRRFKEGEAIGFTYTSSLKSMGLIPRSDGTYTLGDKYKDIK